jgi:hypothetical protein
MIDKTEPTDSEAVAGATEEADIVDAALGLVRRMPMEQRRQFDEAYKQHGFLDECDEHGMPLECRREIDELLAKPPPPAVSDAALETILVDLPKDLDRATARRELEAVWSMHLKEQPFHQSHGWDRPKGQQVEAQKKFVETARAFLEAFTPQIDNLYEYLTHEFEAPRKDRRTPVLEVVSPMADFFEKHAENVGRTDHLSKGWLITVLRIRFAMFGGKGSRKLHRFIANASAPVLATDDKLTPGAVRDHPFFRDKKPKPRERKTAGGNTRKK